MKTFRLFILALCIVLITACKPPAKPITPPDGANNIPADPAPQPEEEEEIPVGKTITVTSTADSGPGTLRQALQNAQAGDTILFDPAVFPPDAPASILVMLELPHIRAAYLTIDASNAGVVLDGSQSEGWAAMQIVSAEGVKVMGLQFTNFSGPGISISGGSTRLIIGGDRNVGIGPFGQGNLFKHSASGVDICGYGTTDISIVGNLIGTDLNASADLGNWGIGISIYDSAQDITIGPDNIIAFNRDGIKTSTQIGEAITITQNQIFSNASHQIWIANLPQGLPSPNIYDFNLVAGTMSGSTCPNCTVEIFSDSSDGGGIFEGSLGADNNGNFFFNKGSAFAGPNLTLTATDLTGNTSPFSVPVSGPGRTVMLQLENDFPIVPVVHKPFDQLAYNHIGVWYEAHDKFWDTNFTYSHGFKRMRIGSLMGEGQWFGSLINEETLSPDVDRTISEYADAGVEIVLILAGGAGLQIPDVDGFQTEADFEQYLAYVNFVVSHFRGRIDAYEILNEPGYLQPEVYATVVERTVPVIRAADPDAKIIIPALHGPWEDGYPGYGEFQRFHMDVPYLNELSGLVWSIRSMGYHGTHCMTISPAILIIRTIRILFKALKIWQQIMGLPGNIMLTKYYGQPWTSQIGLTVPP